MVPEPRFCSSCRAELPVGADACPACGVYAGELYDERMHRPRTRYALFAAWLLVALVAGGAAIWWNQRNALEQPAPAARRTSEKRSPGAVRSDAEALRLVRRHVVATTGLKSDCVVLLGRGAKNGGYHVTARDHCSSTRLGNWRVDLKTGAVTRP